MEDAEWEQIHTPIHSSHPVLTPSDSGEQDLSVFPPSLHEGLDISHITPEEEEEEEEEEELEVNSSVASLSSSTSSNGDGANSGAPRKKANYEICKILSNGIVKVAARVRCYMAFGWGVWSVGAVSGVVAALLLSLVCAKVRRRAGARVKEEKKVDRFILLIQEKDQKINQLLVQLAHMNELLSARRRVQVLRVVS